MAGVLYLDLATSTGWADWAPGFNAPRSSSFTLPSESVGRFVNAYFNWLEKKLSENQYDLIAYELPYIGPKTSQMVGKKLMGLAAITEVLARRFKVKCRDCNIAQVKGHFLGMSSSLRIKKSERAAMTKADIKKRKAEYKKSLKANAILRCQLKGWDVRNDDEADALGGLDFICCDEKIAVPWDCSKASNGLFEVPAGGVSKQEQVAASVLLSRAMQATKGEP